MVHRTRAWVLVMAGLMGACGSSPPPVAPVALPAAASGSLSAEARAKISDRQDQHSFAVPDKV